MILDLEKITWNRKKKGDRIAVSADKKLEAWQIPGEGVFIVEKRRSKNGQKVLAGPLKALMMLCIMFMPVLAMAAGAGTGNFGKTVNLGGGYYIPDMPDGQQFTAGSFNNNVGATFDCANIDWTAQFQQQLNLNLSQQDIKNLGVAAIAGSAKYVAASMMPTWFETIQTALSQAQGIIKVAHADCNSVAQSLQLNDPIGKMRRKLKAKKTKDAAGDGTTFDQALADASKSEFHFSFAKDIAGAVAKDHPETAVMMIGFLGNISVDIGKNGVRKIVGNNPAPRVIDGAYGYLSNVIAKPVFDTLTTGTNCDKPFHLTANGAKLIVAQIKEQQKAKVTPKPVTKGKGKAKPKKKGDGLSNTQLADATAMNARIGNIGDYALSKIDGKHYRILGCDSVQHFKQLQVSADEYQIITEITANNMAIGALKNAIADMKNQIAQLNLTSKSGNGEEVKNLMRGRIAAIEERMRDKQSEIKNEEEIGRAALKLRGERQAQMLAAKSRARQRAGLNQAILAMSPQDFAAGF